MTRRLSVDKPERARKAGGSKVVTKTRATAGSGVTGSLSRGLEIVDTLVRVSRPMGLSDIAAESGLDPSTVHRLLQTLAEAGYVVREQSTRQYLPGPRALSPLSLFHPLTQLRREVAAVLQALRESTGETTALVLYIGLERLVVDFVRGNHPLTPYYDTWLKSPLHGSASGKLLLASLTRAERDRLLGEPPFPALTPKTVTTLDALEKQLDEANRNGYVVARDDAYAGLIAIGAPLASPGEKPMGCVVATAASKTMSASREADIAHALKSAAALLLNTAPSLKALQYWSSRR